MAFCKFHWTVVVKTFFLEINILRANLEVVRVTVTKIIAATHVYNFPVWWP